MNCVSSSPSNIATGKVVLNDTTPVQIVAARPTRVKLKLLLGTVTWVGNSSGITRPTAYRINGAAEVELETGSEIWALSDTGTTPDCFFLETYN